MDSKTLERLQKAGFAATTVTDFLSLSPAEEALVETKVRFTALLKQERVAQGLTQKELAKKLETTQQTVARAESGTNVSLDFLLRALITLGTSLADLGAELQALYGVLNGGNTSSGVISPSETKATPCTEESPCAQAHPADQDFDLVETVDEERVLTRELVVAATKPTAPMLKIIKGGGHTFKSVAPQGSDRRSAVRQMPVAATG